MKATKGILMIAALSSVSQSLFACDIWGPTSKGKDGLMNAEDIYAFIKEKGASNTKEWLAKAKKVAQAIANHTSTSGGGTKYTYNAKTVFHISEQKVITVFFTCKGGGEANSIVGIGNHTGAKSYVLDWTAPAWKVGKNVSL